MAKKFHCLSTQNEIKTFTSFLRDETSGQSVMIHRGETLTHGTYSEWSKEWWLVGLYALVYLVLVYIYCYSLFLSALKSLLYFKIFLSFSFYTMLQKTDLSNYF